LKDEKDKLFAEQEKAGKELKKKIDSVNAEKDPKKKEELKKKIKGELKLFSQRQLAASRKLLKEHKAKKKQFSNDEGKKKQQVIIKHQNEMKELKKQYASQITKPGKTDGSKSSKPSDSKKNRYSKIKYSKTKYSKTRF